MKSINALEKYCMHHGPGLSKQYLLDLRKAAWVSGVEERCLSSGGWSYFPEWAGSQGRIFKITQVNSRVFVEFNLYLSITSGMQNILFLTDNDQKLLHAGGVVFCYIGNRLDEATTLIVSAIESVMGKKYDLLPKYEKECFRNMHQEEVTLFLPSTDKNSVIYKKLLLAYCNKYNLKYKIAESITECLDHRYSKTILAYDFTDKQIALIPSGATLISLKFLAANKKSIDTFKTFKELKEFCRNASYKRNS